MAYKRISPQPVTEGGTGAQTLTGVLTGNGTSAITANAVTQYGTVIAGASNAVTSVAPSATSGVPLISQGAAANPAYGTAVVAGGGTGVTSTTAYAVLCGGTTSTGALQSIASVGTSGQVLTSNGAGALPTFQGSSAGITTLNGDSGSATGSTVTIKSGNSTQNCGSSVTITGAAATLTMNVSDGSDNTIIGKGSGNGSLSGSNNVGVGDGNLAALTSGSDNGAFGRNVLVAVTSGINNAGLGSDALNHLTTGAHNIAIGVNSLARLTTGSYNACFGDDSGFNYTSSEVSNIAINAFGTTGESNTLRLGDATGTGNRQINKAVICGINGIVVTGTAVLVSASDQLGVAASSARFKDNIVDMADASNDIRALRPVTFTYKGSQETRYGLIAEEVATVYPNLVVYDKEGLPQTVMYHELPSLLLNELQKALKRIEVLEAQVKELNGNK